MFLKYIMFCLTAKFVEMNDNQDCYGFADLVYQPLTQHDIIILDVIMHISAPFCYIF